MGRMHWSGSPVAAAAAIAGLLVVASPSAAQESVELGEPRAAYGEGFSLIAGLRELSDGRVLVADALDESLVELDPELRAARKIGRNGQGPEEYRQPDALFAIAADTTLMTDLGNGRLTVLAPNGHFARTIPVSQERDGRLLIVLPEAVDDAGRLYFQPRGDGMIRDSAVVVRWDPSVGTTDTLAVIKLQDVTETSSGGAGRFETRVMPIPLSPQDGWAAGPDGRLAVVRAADYRVEWLTADGRSVSGPATAYDPVRVRSADKEEWVDRLASTGLMMMVTNEGGQVRTAMRRGGPGGDRGPSVESFAWPDAKPPFDPQAVQVAPDGRLWVGRHVPAGDRPRFDVFDEEGRRVGSVVLPQGRTLVGFGAASVYLAHRDELDFQWLERYDLPPR